MIRTSSINALSKASRQLLFAAIYLFSLTVYGADYQHGDLAPRGAPDGQLNAADVVIMQRLATGEITPSYTEGFIGDVAPLNNPPDGLINGADLAVLQRAVLGEISLGTVNVLPEPPILDGSDATTNSNPYPVNGTATADITVYLYINGQRRAETVADSIDGSFSFSAALYDDDNVIYATTWDGSDESLPSENNLTITYQNIIPRTQSGVINSDTVWTPGSTPTPYTIDGPLTVADGVTFTIQPGTVLEFTNLGWLEVNGTLKVQGSLTEKVSFTSADPGAYVWSGINIKSGASDVIIDHAIIEYAGYGVAFDNGTGTLTNSLIENCSIAGIYVYGGNARPYLERNIIRQNKTGIYVLGTGFAGGNPEPEAHTNRIYDNYITPSVIKNYWAEVFYQPSDTVLDATGNWWGTIDVAEIAAGIDDISDDAAPYYKPYVNYSNFINSDGTTNDPVPFAFNSLYVVDGDTVLTPDTTYVVMGDILIESGESLTIPEGVTLEVPGPFKFEVYGTLDVNPLAVLSNKVVFTSGNETPAAANWVGINAYPGSSVNIDGAIIEYATTAIFFNDATGSVSNSQIQNNDTAIKTQGAAATPLITDNIIQDNIGPGGPGYGIQILDGSAPQVINNDILNNNIGLSATGTGVAGGNPVPVVNGNRIDNITMNYTTGSFYDSTHVVLNATGNGWGSTSAAEISGKIQDITDTPASSPYVDYSGFLDRDGVPVLMNALYEINDALDGVVDGVMTLEPNKTYTVLGNVTVESGESLHIPEGVIIFMPGAQGVTSFGITVYGGLDVVGTEASRVVFTSEYFQPDPVGNPNNWVPYSWQGIVINGTNSVNIDYAIIEHAGDGMAGLSFIDAGGTVSHSLIHHNATGIYMQGTSNPVITDNTIINNDLYGIHLKGAGNDASNPLPTITGNDIYFNALAQVYIENYGAASQVVINLTDNWWGVPTPTAGTALYYDQIVFSGANPPTPTSIIDYSVPKSSAAQGIGLISSALTEVYISPAPPDGRQDSTQYSATLTEAADSWTVKVLNSAGGTVATFPPGSGANVNVTWDGAGQGDGIYTFVTTATVGARTSQLGYRFVTIDNTLPYDVTVLINAPDYISYTNVDLAYSAMGANQMIRSELPDFSDASWSSIVPSEPWMFSPVEGTHTIYVKFRDLAGNETQASDSVVLDLSPPVITITSQGNGTIF